MVILPTAQYESKIEDFIQTNNFQTSTKNQTKTFQAQVRKAINKSKTLIPPENKWKHININPTAPSIKGLIKLHKSEQPIRPVVNWRGTPAYKLALLFTQKIHQMAPPPNTYNLQNTRDLIKKLEDTPILPHFALASLDITNLYTNIPVKETRDIIANTLEKNQIETQTGQELINWYNIITKQNYFTNNGKNPHPTRWTSHGRTNLRHNS